MRSPWSRSGLLWCIWTIQAAALHAISGVASRGTPKVAFQQPPSDAVDCVDPLIGNGGDSPNGSGGMIPSTAPPFAMTRWVAQTRQNYVSVTPYNYTDNSVHGFQGTHQPAIWMGESGQIVVVPGAGDVKAVFEERGMAFSHTEEVITPSYYSVELDAIEGGTIISEQSATSRVGHLRFTFNDTERPYILIEASRASVMGSADPNNLTYPHGAVDIEPVRNEITGHNKERQDFIIGPNPATKFAGYFCARFSEPVVEWGTASNSDARVVPGQRVRSGSQVSAYVRFDESIKTVEVRVGVSFISVDQARRNLDREAPDGTSLEKTAQGTREAWAEKLDRINIDGASTDDKTTFYTAVFHTLQVSSYFKERGKFS
ncbi:hypothetical protein PHLCEN_2v3147 [Hermanssonia centrifuga]|uniref:Glycoside hydrolase family 92 protein n=1 Tax=Hermanssonia centrifuga TaxID=98765 RepID=A0A2R6R118_9APHY|nr:hypothetical protein PHLCEN_2v3147 [Hermanssonia centrifuga]